MDHTSCFVDTKLTKGQFFSMFSANIYLASKIVMNLKKTPNTQSRKYMFLKTNVGGKGSKQMLPCRNVLLPQDRAMQFP